MDQVGWHESSDALMAKLKKTMEPQSQLSQLTINYPLKLDQRHVQEALVAVLYNNGELSSKEACDLARLTRREFEERVLPQFGFSVKFLI